MTATSPLSNPITVDRAWGTAQRVAALVFVIVLALVAFGIGRATVSDDPVTLEVVRADEPAPSAQPAGITCHGLVPELRVC